MKRFVLALSALALALAACGTGADVPEDDLLEPAASETTTTTVDLYDDTPLEPAEVEDTDDTPVVRTPVVKSDLTAQIAMAESDLAGRLGMGEADIALFVAEPVTWRDGSMGCPIQGRAYTQALIEDGYRIILTANGETHHYHGAGDGEPFYCENPQEPYNGGAGSTSPDA